MWCKMVKKENCLRVKDPKDCCYSCSAGGWADWNNEGWIFRSIPTLNIVLLYGKTLLFLVFIILFSLILNFSFKKLFFF